MKSIKEAFLLEPQYRDYVWGGSRLRPGITPTAEAWVVYQGNRIRGGRLAGRTLAEAAVEYGPALLGVGTVEQTGLRFPLLIKLLDCAAWLSLQVHPNNEQAQRLEGPGFFGKAEAWYFIEAAPGAEILAGVQPGTTPQALEEAIRNGRLLDCMQRHAVHSGDSIFIRPGTIHALGPGLLLYEVQQTSDLTYRVYDWDRPASQGRALHIEKSIAVADPAARGEMLPLPVPADGEQKALVSSSYFTLEILAAESATIDLDTGGESFQALTVVEGRARLEGDGWSLELERLSSAIVPADCGAFHIQPVGACRVLRAVAG